MCRLWDQVEHCMSIVSVNKSFRAPRWASINLGIFICMRCSGIHRSLGVHISKVRSTTLDTWLPEQVSFMHSVGNRKANSYWEAELPPNHDRSNTEDFIRTKYQKKRWASKKIAQPTEEVGESSSSVGSAKISIPKKARKYSLEEDMFIKPLSAPIPVTKSHACSVDMGDTFSFPPSSGGQIPARNAHKKNAEAKPDLLTLFSIPENKQERSLVPPSRWATFE